MINHKMIIHFRIVILTCIVLASCEILLNEKDTTLSITGYITDLDTQAPIADAKIELWKFSLTNSPEHPLVEVFSNQNGLYELTYTQEDHCGESLFNLVANKTAYISVSYNSINTINDSTALYIKCTEKIQTFNFSLERF